MFRTHPIPAAALLALLVLVHGGCASDDAQPDSQRWYKGNLHTHSLWSDGDDFPEMIADWYKARGYDFLALSDHNILSEGEKWVKYGDMKRKNPAADQALAKYTQRFGDKVQTRGDIESQTLEVRLRTLTEFRGDVEDPGKFLMIPAEEITDKFEKKPIHMNATNVGEVIKPQGGASVKEVIANNIRAVQEQSARLNRPILPHLNHPNYHYGVSAEELAHVVEERFFEVYNGHPAVHHEGDHEHPSVEHLWDIANTIRLAQLKAAPLMGLATDDSHNYHVTGMARSTPGRGWVMVRAKELTPESLIAAMEAGEFYASSGVTLRDVRYDANARTLTVDIEPDDDATFTTQFVGTPADFDKPPNAGEPLLTPLNSPQVGTVFATVQGNRAVYKLTGKELYVRAVITSSKPAENPSIKDQKKQAWTQPVGWKTAN